MTSQIPISFRRARLEDGNFVFSSWLKSYRGSDFAKHMTNDVYYGHHKSIVAALIAKSIILVACNPEDENQVFGYIVFEHERGCLVHWLYVKYTYRKLGVANALIGQLPNGSGGITLTHIGRSFQELKAKYNLEYNPYLL